MTDHDPIIGPPSRPADPVAFGFRWCACGLHQHPAQIGTSVLRVAKGCPSCFPKDYSAHVQKKQAAHVVTWMTDDSQRVPREAS